MTEELEPDHKELIMKSEEIRKQASLVRQEFSRLLDLIEFEFCIARKDSDDEPNTRP